MGLLDQFSNLNEEQTQGLLAAASQMLQQSGPSRTPVGFGQILGGGMGAYQDSTLAARKRKLEEEQVRQMAQLRGLQIQEAQGGLADSDLKRQDAKSLRGFQEEYALKSAPTGQPAQPDMSSMMGPTTANAAKLTAMQQAPQPQQPQSQYDQAMGYAQFLQSKGRIHEAMAAAKEAQTLKPKFSTTPQPMLDASGKLRNYQLSEDGGPARDLGLGVKPDMVATNLGSTTRWDDKNALTPGQQFTHQQSPDSAAADRRAAADRAAGTDPNSLLPDATVSMMAQQYRAGDISVMQNLGRGSQGAQNIIRLRNEIAKQTSAGGMGGADLAAKNAEYFGTKAGQRTAGTRIANVEMASSEAESLIPLARQASAAVLRSGLLPFGKAQVMFDNQTNDPALRQFAAANNALVTVYSRAISPSGVPTVADKEHAREMISTAMDDKSYQAVLDQMQKEITAARAAPKAVRKAFNDEVTGRGHSPEPAAGGALSITAPNGKTYNFPDAKALANFKLSAGIR